MNVLPRICLRSLGQSLRLRPAGSNGPRWLVRLPNEPASQPRLRPPARPRRRPATTTGYCFSTSCRLESYRLDDDDESDHVDAMLEELFGPLREPEPGLPPVSTLLTPPLDVLFCGSDAFSCASLQALHDEMRRQQGEDAHAAAAVPTGMPRPGRIASIHVLVRPAKAQGRGLKKLQLSPVETLARSLNLPVYARDSFTNWTPPQCNLIVAVSFGLFVPPRVLKAAAYGGLNVHPSLLPDLHGASPIEHAILLGRRFTGVSIQTLDDKKFDGGHVLRTSRPVELLVERGGGSGWGVTTAAELYPKLATLGANVLLQVLRRGLYVFEAQRRRVAAVGVARVVAEDRERLQRFEKYVRTPVLPVKEMDSLDRFGRADGHPVNGEAFVPVMTPFATMPHPETTSAATLPAVMPAAAPKLNKADQEVPWRPLPQQHPLQKEQRYYTTAADIDRRARALGRLWTYTAPPPPDKMERALGQAPLGALLPSKLPPSRPPPAKPRKPTRLLLDDIDVVACPPRLRAVLEAAPAPYGASRGSSSIRSIIWKAEAEAVEEEDEPVVRTVTFRHTPPNAANASSPYQKPPVFEVTLPYVVDTEDGESVILPIGVPPDSPDADKALCCLRVGRVLVEGDAAKPAARALQTYAQRLNKMHQDDVAAALDTVSWDVVFGLDKALYD